MDHSHLGVSSLLVALLAIAFLDGAHAGPLAGSLMEISETEPFVHRQLQYLQFATSSPLDSSSILNVMNHLELASRQPNSTFPLEPNTIRADAWDNFIERPIGNFGMLWILNALFAFEGDPAAELGLWERAKQAVLDFKYWFVDPPAASTTNSTEYCMVAAPCRFSSLRIRCDLIFLRKQLRALFLQGPKITP